jgi:hypothetical protein
MTREVLVNEPVDTLIRLLPDGEVRPTSFLWRDRTRYVENVGRQWEERVAGKTLRCFLLQTVDANTFELRWDPGANTWAVHRAWLRDAVV